MPLPKELRNAGLHRHRLRDNPEEKRFALAWRKLNERPNGNLAATLGLLLSETQRPAEVSDRDALVAATVVQWLGSHVGQNWLGELGYERQAKRRGDDE